MFSRLIGNDMPKLTLKRLIELSRLPNSLLFVGPEGVGKKQFAIESARLLACRSRKESEACGICSSCMRMSKADIPAGDKSEDFDRMIFSDHPDLGFVLPYKRNVRIGAIRSLEREANFNPYEAMARVFIIDEADLMKDGAANALLKTLEEPPATTHIILITSRPDVLLPTIRSRCQTVHFAPVERAQIENFLVEDRAFTRDEARIAAGLAHGSIAKALEINVDDYRARRDRSVRAIRAALIENDTPTLLKISEELNDAKNKDRFEENIDTLESIIRDIWRLACGIDREKILDPEMSEEFAKISDSVGPKRLSDWLMQIETLRQNLAVNINKKVAMDSMFLTMAAGR